MGGDGEKFNNVVSIRRGPNRACGRRCSEPIKGKIEPKRRSTKGTHIEYYLKIQNYHSRCNGCPYAYSSQFDFVRNWEISN